MKRKIDMSECEVNIVEDSEYTVRDKMIEMLMDYIHTNTEFEVERDD
ncbi:hypothetical protein [Halobacillus sp. Marseille-P3879]|nr:hypothetical protein [Halobacillus sp. Marseille-P3879]